MSGDSNKCYSMAEAAHFIEFLGCWRYPSPYYMITYRDPAEYRELLFKVINVNKTRKDKIGAYETEFARQALERMDKQK
jgi:hypothetical protein